MEPAILEIIEKAKRLDEVEKKYLKFTYEVKTPGNETDFTKTMSEIFAIAQEASDLKTDIEKKFIDITTITIQDNKIREILNKIKSNQPFYSIKAYEMMIDLLNKDEKDFWSRYPATTEDKLLVIEWDNLHEDFHSSFDMIRYFFDKICVGPLIVTFQIPQNMISYFDEIRESFSFGMYRSSIALCRALLEMALYLKLLSKGFFKANHQNVVKIDLAKEDKFYKFINAAEKCKILDLDKSNRAHNLRAKVNKVLHLKETKDIPAPKREEALEIIKETSNIIDYLYR